MLVDDCGLVGGKPGTPWGPILIYKGEPPNIWGFSFISCSLTERGGVEGGGPVGRGWASLLTDMPDSQEKLTEIYVVQIHRGKQKGS